MNPIFYVETFLNSKKNMAEKEGWFLSFHEEKTFD